MTRVAQAGPLLGDESFAAYLAAEDFVQELVEELRLARPGVKILTRERLVLLPGPPVPSAWAQNVWLAPRWLPIASIGDAAKQLRDIQRNWVCFPQGLHRRAALIQERLPKVSGKPRRFGEPAPSAPLGSWTLWDENLILASPSCSSPFPNGELQFEENKTAPPNRAYLKLWEAFTRLGERPAPGQLCLDLGSSPGGWSWVLHECGASVFSVDKAELAPEIMRLPRVEFCRGSGFGLDPRQVGPVDWLCCDMACYPQRLLEMVERWFEHGECRRFVCTLKLQAATDHDIARRFAAIPGSTLMHLFHNKHELTWAWGAEREGLCSETVQLPDPAPTPRPE
jgi:23S rRNA (cytidine2498-2'-O)-methyltransferase